MDAKSAEEEGASSQNIRVVDSLELPSHRSRVDGPLHKFSRLVVERPYSNSKSLRDIVFETLKRDTELDARLLAPMIRVSKSFAHQYSEASLLGRPSSADLGYPSGGGDLRIQLEALTAVCCACDRTDIFRLTLNWRRKSKILRPTWDNVMIESTNLSRK